MGLYSGGGGGSQPDPVEVRRAELEKGFQSYKKAMAATEPSVSNMAAVGVVYQPGKTNWKVTKEKTDFKTVAKEYIFTFDLIMLMETVK
jgi:hypothetical protein